jgi:hypothetical protein
LARFLNRNYFRFISFSALHQSGFRFVSFCQQEPETKSESQNEMKPTHPFAGGIPARGITRKHSPLIWEAMLGTVKATDGSEEGKYFDYDYEAARAFAGVAQCTDLRIVRSPRSYQCGLREGRVALFGVRQ